MSPLAIGLAVFAIVVVAGVIAAMLNDRRQTGNTDPDYEDGE